MNTVARLLLACLCLALAASTTRAEDQLPRMPIFGGIICDTAEEVIGFIAGEAPPGCGTLRQPTPADVYITGIHEAEGQRYLLARYEFPKVDGTFYVQYGFWGAPQPIPASLDIAL